MRYILSALSSMKNTEEGNDLTLLEVSLEDKDKEQNNNNILPGLHTICTFGLQKKGLPLLKEDVS